MQMISNVLQRLRILFPTVLKIYLPAFLFYGLMWYITRSLGIGIYPLTADPGEISGQPPYIGLISNIGNLIWCGTSAVCIFSAFLIKTNSTYAKRWFKFLLISGIFTAALLLDDMFRIHENYAMIFAGTDANLAKTIRGSQNLFEGMFFVAIFSSFLLYLFYFRKHILNTEYLFFVLAFAFLSMSVLVDMAPGNNNFHHLTEEGFKFFGIVSWSAYFFRTCWASIRSYQLDHD